MYKRQSRIFLASLLTGLNIFDNIAKVGGAGTLVPITGFSNSITAPALEFKSEGFILGPVSYTHLAAAETFLPVTA